MPDDIENTEELNIVRQTYLFKYTRCSYIFERFSVPHFLSLSVYRRTVVLAKDDSEQTAGSVRASSLNKTAVKTAVVPAGTASSSKSKGKKT